MDNSTAEEQADYGSEATADDSQYQTDAKLLKVVAQTHGGVKRLLWLFFFFLLFVFAHFTDKGESEMAHI